jgi:hypothetical protein
MGHLVAPEERVAAVPLTRTSCWSNQAHVVRVSKWHGEAGDHRPGPGRVTRCTASKTRCIGPPTATSSRRGFYEANNRWGVYYYGDVHAKPKIAHINGALHAGTIWEYVNKAKQYMSRTSSSLRD